MRWITARSVSGHELYQLYKGDKKIMTLNFNPFSSSVRIEFDNEQRVFLIRKEGFRKKKTVLRSEYGVKIGELGHEHHKEFIDLNGDRYFYATRNHPQKELVLYKEVIEEPVLTCGLKASNGSPGLASKQSDEMDAFTHSGLLIALCWYMFLPAARESEAELVS